MGRSRLLTGIWSKCSVFERLIDVKINDLKEFVVRHGPFFVHVFPVSASMSVDTPVSSQEYKNNSVRQIGNPQV